MGSFFAYSLYSGVFLMLLYLAYRLFISGEKQIALNRIILIGCYVVSFAVWPLSRFDWSRPESRLSVADPIIAVRELPINIVGQLSMNTVEVIEEDASVVPLILLWIYMIGAVIILLKTIYSTARLIFYIRKGTFIPKNGYTLVIMPGNDTAPFSFGNHVVMSSVDCEAVCCSVTAHELAHIRYRHYLDLIIAQTVCVVLWYNPASWLMRKELKLIHEYQADASVIDSGADPKEYQMLLIRKTVSNRFHTFANSLNHSNLKNRIAMMQKEKSSGLRRLRILSLALAVDVALAVVNIPAVASSLHSIEDSGLNSLGCSSSMQDSEEDVIANEENISAVASGLGDHEFPGVNSLVSSSSIHGNEEAAAANDVKNRGEVAESGISARFPGGGVELLDFLNSNMRYPDRAQKERRSGRTVVGYTIEKDGKLSNISILESSWPDLDEAAVSLVKKMPDWLPAERNGKLMATEFTLPFNFHLPSDTDSKEDENKGEHGAINRLDEIVVIGYGAIMNEYAGSQKNEGRCYRVEIMKTITNPDMPYYVDGVLTDREEVKSISPKSIESWNVLGPIDGYPEGRNEIKLKKDTKTLHVDNIELTVGPCNEKDCDDLANMEAFRVDGKLLTQSMTIKANDIESMHNFPPSKEFPYGLCEIKLKKK